MAHWNLFEARGVRVLEHSCVAGAVGPIETLEITTHAVGVVRHGVGELWLDGRRVIADPTQMVLLRAGTHLCVRHHGCRGSGCAVTIHADEAAVGTLARSLNGGATERRFSSGVLLSAPPTLAHALHGAFTLARGRRRPGRAALELVEARLQLLVAALLDRMQGGDGAHAWCWLSTSELVRRVREAIALRATHPVSFTELSREIGRSRFHLCHTFKTETGVTMTQYLHRLRVWRALYRIAEGQDRLTELALELGFSSHSHFTSVFRRHLGTTPSHLRQEYERWLEAERPPAYSSPSSERMGKSSAWRRSRALMGTR